MDSVCPSGLANYIFPALAKWIPCIISLLTIYRSKSQDTADRILSFSNNTIDHLAF